jgi:DNA-binding ferritin-like protein
MDYDKAVAQAKALHAQFKNYHYSIQGASYATELPDGYQP